jgi:hypothetical protein
MSSYYKVYSEKQRKIGKLLTPKGNDQEFRYFPSIIEPLDIFFQIKRSMWIVLFCAFGASADCERFNETDCAFCIGNGNDGGNQACAYCLLQAPSLGWCLPLEKQEECTVKGGLLLKDKKEGKCKDNSYIGFSKEVRISVSVVVAIIALATLVFWLYIFPKCLFQPRPTSLSVSFS